MIPLLIILLIVVLIGCLFFVFSGRDETAARIASVSRSQMLQSGEMSVEAMIASRRRHVRDTLKGMDEEAKKRKKSMSIRLRLNQAGFPDVPASRFWIISAILGGVVLAISLVAGKPPLFTLLITVTAGLGLPRWGLSFLQKRRQKKFTNDFANALDVIIRSVRSGLPIFEALKVVATDFREPVSGEFKRLIDGVGMGLSLTVAMERMYESMPTVEVGFFAVVMSIQQQSGGNLAEALGNLASVLRDRRRLEDKIKSLSSEAKSTAAIIGSLPVAVALLLYLTSPNYIMPMITTKSGNLLLIGCLIWMGIGVFIMKQMINFKR